MEAKDTVMVGHYSPEEFTRLNKQAEISFKAGIKEVAEWLQNNCKYELEPGINGRDLATFIVGEWQAKLKEWELEH